MALKGDAAFKYNPGGGDITVPLAIPIFQPAPGRYRFRRVREALDGTSREVLTVGSGLNEITASIRFIDNISAVLALLEYWADDNEPRPRYVPSLASPGVEIPDLMLIEPSGDRHELAREVARMSRGECQVQLRIRRVDGGDFSALPGMPF